MEVGINIYSFFEKIEIIREKISPFAKRSGISEDAAILLTIIYFFPNKDLPINDELYEQLKLKGLIIGDESYSATGKGAILAKSFSEILKMV